MKEGRLGYLDYVKAAFGWRYRIPLLGGMPANIFAVAGFAILGLGHPAFWLLGLAYEAAYLIFLAGSDRFQKVVDGTRLLKARARVEKRQQDLLQGLDRQARERYQRLAQQAAAVVENSRLSGSAAEDLRTHGLAQLLGTFLQLLCSRQRIGGILAQVTEPTLREEISRTVERLAREKEGSPLHRSLQGSLDIANKRLENLTRAQESLRVVEAELERIEKQFAYLVEETSVSSDPVALTARLDGVMQSLQDTSRWLSENRELLGAMEEPAVEIPLAAGRQPAKEQQ